MSHQVERAKGCFGAAWSNAAMHTLGTLNAAAQCTLLPICAHSRQNAQLVSSKRLKVNAVGFGSSRA